MSVVVGPAACEAELFGRQMGSGKSRPLALHARGADDVLVECIVKPSANLVMPPNEYLFEWVAACVGRALGLNVPAPLAVTITPAFAASVTDAATRAVLTKSVGTAYGSTFAKGYTQIPTPFALSTNLRDQAAAILAFDVLIHNPDRRAVNPNLFVARDQFLVFDHEAAFAFLFAILGGDASEDPCNDIVSTHVLRSQLRGAMPSLGDFGKRLAALDDAFFQGVQDATPKAWTIGPAVGKIEAIIDLLRRRRDAAGRWLPKVEAWMAR